MPIDDRFAVALVCRQMLRELLSMAEHHGMGLQELEGELRTETGAVKLEIRLVEPTRDERHLAQLVELQLERRTWSGGVVAHSLDRASARDVWSKLRAVGLAIDAETKTSRAFNALVDRLSSRLEHRRGAASRSSFPTHSPSTWSGSSRGRTLDRPKTDRFTLPPEQSRGRPFRLLGHPSAD